MASEQSIPESSPNPNTPLNLQFERAEPVTGGSLSETCGLCHEPIREVSYRWQGHILCSACAAQAETYNSVRPTGQDYLRAAIYGIGAAIAGTVLYYVILALTGYEIGLLAVFVGWMVGKAVHKRSRQLGGRKLQVLAVVLTYFSIVGSYAPLIVQQIMKQSSEQTKTTKEMDERPLTAAGTVARVAVLIALCLALPFLQGVSSIIGLFIIGIGLLQAWKINKRPVYPLEGPYPVQPFAAST